MSRLPPPMTVPRNPATMTMPVCSSSHSEAFSWLPAASSRALIRISRLLLRLEQLGGGGLGRRQLVLLLGRGVVAGACAPGRVHLDGFLGGHLPRLRDRHGEDSEETDAERDETGVERPGWQVGQCQDDDKRAHRAPREKSIGSTVTLECVIFSRNLGRRPVGIRPPMARPCWSKPAEWS